MSMREREREREINELLKFGLVLAVVCWDIFTFSPLFYVQTGKVESGEGGGCVPSLLESVL